MFNANIRMSYQGGDRYTPIDEAASLESKDIIYKETEAFSKQFSPAFTVDLGVSYKLNRKRISHEFGIQFLNLTGYTGQHGYQYNEQNITHLALVYVITKSLREPFRRPFLIRPNRLFRVIKS